MKIAFVSMGPSSPFSIGLLSAVIKKDGHDVRLFYDPALFNDGHVFKLPKVSKFFDAQERIVSDVLSYKPDLIGFSVMTNTYQWSLQMANALKDNYQKPIIFGGIHPTSVPEIVIQEKCVDMVNIGEGIQSFPELISCIAQKDSYNSIKNIWFKENGRIIKNEIRPLFKYPDKLPFCDFSLFEDILNLKDYSILSAHQGCPYHCSFCSTTVLKKIYKHSNCLRRSPGNVINELSLAKKKYSIRTVNFHDDVFTSDRKWLELFLRAYKKEINLPLKVISHIKNIDKNILLSLKAAGCNKIEFGIQSTNERLRRDVLKRPEKNDEITRTLSLCEKFGMPYQVDHIFDVPGEEEKDYIDAAKFYAELKPARISTSWLTYFPKTEIVEIALQSGRITDKDILRIEQGFIDPYHVEKKGTPEYKRQSKIYFLFLLMPLLPRRINQLLVRSKLYFIFPSIPFPVKLLVELLHLAKMRDYRKVNIFFRYIRFLRKELLKKLY